jgi:hypothetical protein
MHVDVYAIQDGRGVEKAQNGMGWNMDGAAYTVDTLATQAVAIIPTGDSVNTAAASQLTFFAEEHPASLSVSQDSEKDWMTRVATSCLPLVPLLQSIGPAGWFGRTSPAYCPQTEDGTLVPSSGCWASSGMGSPTEFLTLSTPDWHSGASVCSLSDVLETGDVPQRYFLSATACRGILRRADKRGKELPPALMSALAAVAKQPSTPAGD